jgi:hypothetical protein
MPTNPFVIMQQKRGLKASLPTSAPAGQLLIATDTKELFFGTGTGIEQIGDSTQTFTQSAASTIWTITHNLGKYPSVTTVNNNGELIEGLITFISANQLTIQFSPAVAGKAYLN